VIYISKSQIKNPFPKRISLYLNTFARILPGSSLHAQCCTVTGGTDCYMSA